MKHCRHWPNDRHSGYFNGIAYCLGGENKYAAAVWTGEKSTSRWTSATCDAMGGPPASATSSGDYCALHDAPTDCLRMRTPGVGPNDNYSRVISHFICKIASADRPGAAINFPPLKLFRLDGKDHDAVGRPPGESERARENDIVWMNGAIAAAAQS